VQPHAGRHDGAAARAQQRALSVAGRMMERGTLTQPGPNKTSGTLGLRLLCVRLLTNQPHGGGLGGGREEAGQGGAGTATCPCSGSDWSCLARAPPLQRTAVLSLLEQLLGLTLGGSQVS
jgi:hypothetical protein